MKKKLVSILLAASMVATLGACGSSSSSSSATSASSASSSATSATSSSSAEDPVQTLINNTTGTVDLTLWCSELDTYQNAMKEIVDNFKKQYSDVDFNITIGSESEANVKDDLLKDVESGADVFVFADDQINDLVKAKALQEVSATYTYDPKETNSQQTVDAATVDGKLYAYPLTASNGYFLYYDSSVFSDDDVASWDAMLKKANDAGTQVGMDLANGWYLYSFFKGAGLDVSLNDAGNNDCNWNATDGTYKGTDVAEAITNIATNKAFKNEADQDAMSDVKDGKLKAYVSGTWDSDTVKSAYGDGYAAAKLPTFTCAGDQVQMSSFAGYKFVGVNAYSKQTGWAMLLAEYITNEENQLKIGSATGEGPANTNAAAQIDSPALKALSAQSQYANLQRVAQPFWDPATALGQSLAEGKYSDAQKLLDDAVKGITADASAK